MVMWYVSKVLGKERVQMLKAIDDFVWGVPLIVLAVRRFHTAQEEMASLPQKNPDPTGWSLHYQHKS